ncbi:MAG TPA: endolytic transglycosylase MltG [Gammaproteobacteria bacterium]|nr:endolytic transglycosylase MltG [Gammaproteobacteria bacterium]
MRKKKIFLLSFVIISFSILILFTKIFFGQGSKSIGNVILFSKGQNLNDLSVILTDKGLISSQLVFKIGIRIIGGEDKLQAGEYYIKPHESMRSIYKKIVEGDTITYSLTIPEGLTNKQVFSILETNPQLTGDIDELKYAKEGIFLPETYFFKYNETKNAMLKRLAISQEEYLNNYVLPLLSSKENVSSVLKDIGQILILSSLVEEEAKRDDERARIAAVFLNRLKSGMKLESDPTVIYGITLGKRNLNRKLNLKDLKTFTEYNTYLIKGLPPTPISNPGKKSIEAVLNPLSTQELYFVSDGYDGHFFSETYDQHKKNVAKYRETIKLKQLEQF